MLALIGSGEYLPPVDPVDRYLFERLGTAPRVVCLPTAAGTEGDERVTYWMELGEKHYRRLGVQVQALPVIDRQSANDPEHAEKVAEANFVYLSGGRPAYLYETLKDTPVWQAIQAVHAAGGVVAGCSAGAMVMGAGFPGFPRWTPGFGLLPGAVIFPHFDEMAPLFVSGVRRLVKRGSIVVGIDGSTALFANGTEKRVIGLGGVSVIGRSATTRYTHGQEVTW